MQVADFDFGPVSRNGKYDWARLFDGRVWELVSGENFTCAPDMFRRQAYVRATREGKRVRVAIRGDRVYLQLRDGAA